LIEILSELDDWSKYYNLFENLDVYYSKEYVSASTCLEPGSQPFAVYFEAQDARVWYPFLIRPIPGWGTYTDMITAYGYGGPHLEGNPERIAEFYKELIGSFCKDKNAVTETIRLHPLTQNHLTVQRVMEVMPVRKTIAVDLIPDYTDITNNYWKTRRKEIRDSIQKYNLQVHQKYGEEAIDSFLKLYVGTMKRNNALPQYYFDHNYFSKMMKENPLCNPQMLFVSYEGTIINGKLNLIGKKYAHGHLAAANAEYFYLHPDQVLIDYSIKSAKEAGASMFHMGGGYKEGDGIFKFKSSFSKGKHKLFYIGKQILNQSVYEEIISNLSINPACYPDFFPIYRYPLIAHNC
jgi:hypothetical protein